MTETQKTFMLKRSYSNFQKKKNNPLVYDYLGYTSTSLIVIKILREKGIKPQDDENLMKIEKFINKPSGIKNSNFTIINELFINNLYKF